ncbi:hypothetical protein BaRGS_00028122 [Batillaria attramentaria]|uniref:C2H2-type domain-containing protein n=1 Tax=Batillaria attramentaria TaxID=370345 RepID=A0ABD0JZW0_9CAEN
MASEFSDDTSELGGENEGVPMSSASSISNDIPSEPQAVMSETEDSNSFSIEPSSSETDSYFGTGSKVKDDGSHRSSLSDVTQGSGPRDTANDGAGNKGFPVRPGIMWRKGERLEAMDYLQKWYPAKITDIDEDQKCVLIHFEGWNQRYDEWVDMGSDYLRPLTRHSERRDKRRRERTVYKVGDQVLAKWTDCKMYLAKIDEVLTDGSYVVLFYDGFKKTIQSINLRPAPSEQKQQKFKIKPPVLSPKDLKKLKQKPVDFKGNLSDENPDSSESQPPTKPHRTHTQGALHKKKLIVSGSLFAKREKSEKTEVPQTTKPQKKNKEAGKVKEKLKEKQEVKPEAPAEVKDKAPGTEASCQTEVATSTEPPAKKKKRAGSFPPAVGKGKKPKVPKTSKSTAAPGPASVKKTKSADEGKLLEPPVPGVPPKAFVVEEDHNTYKCTVPGCNKGFRKAGLLASHVKYYHCDNGGQPSTPTGPRKRKKTLSTCSTDSDISVGSRSNSAKRRRHVSEISLTGSPDVAMRMSFDDDSPNSTTRTELPPVEENPPVEMEEEASEEVVNCICGFREENGLMIQCDACLCWQHTQCFNITDEDLTSNSTYICFVCKRPPGVRDSCKHLHDLDWFRKGRLPTFSFLNLVPSKKRQQEVKRSHDLVGEVLRVQKVMHGLREQMALTGEREHPELRLWHNKPARETRSVAVSTQDIHRELAISPSVASADNSSSHVHHSTDCETRQQGERDPLTSGRDVLKTELDTSVSSQAVSVSASDVSTTVHTTTSTDSVSQSVASTSGEAASGPSGGQPVVNGKIKLENGDLKQETAETSVAQDSAKTEDGEQDTVKSGEGQSAADGQNAGVDTGTVKSECPDNTTQARPQTDLEPKAEIKTEATTTVQRDPFADCKMSALRYVHQVQDELALALDALEVQISDLERQEFGEEAAGSFGNIPALKHSLYRIMRDLNKVKGIASYR